MDPGGSELDSSLSQHENPCLIVEDSQPDSVALEDDPESSYRALLSRRLSHLQPSSHSPVLELISSPSGSRCSQTIDSQSDIDQSNLDSAPDSAQSQVVNTCPPPNKTNTCSSADINMDSGADSTTHCVQLEEHSQFGFLELSESQGLAGKVEDSQEEESQGGDKEVILPKTDQERHADQKIRTGTLGRQDCISARSEVSSSSSAEDPGQADRALRVQALLHSQVMRDAGDNHNSEILSSQEDMFDADKTGASVDSTVSEPDNRPFPTLTPAHSLRLLHLSGQGTLVQESLSQNSADCVAPTQDNLSHAPLIVPNSPTKAESEIDADEPMDTSQPPDDQTMEKEGTPMEMATFSKPQPKASTPLSQNSPSFVLERTLSLPSQPEFSHDVFVPTPSLEGGSSSGIVAPRESQGTKASSSSSLPRDKSSPAVESASFTLALQLTVNTESSMDLQAEEDSQATQIEDLGEPLRANDSSTVHCSQRTEHGVSSLVVSDSQKREHDPARFKDADPPQRSGDPERTAASLCLENVNVDKGEGGRKAENSAEHVSRSQPTADSLDLAVDGCVKKRPSKTTPCTAASPPACSETAVVNVATGAENATEPRTAVTVKNTSPRSPSREGAPSGDSPTDAGNLGDGEEGEESMEEEEVTVGPDGSGLGLALSQSQRLSPEPMEEESEGRRGDDARGGFLKEAVKSSQMSQEARSAHSELTGSRSSTCSTNGHQSPLQSTGSQVAPDRLSQNTRAGPDLDGPKDKSLSDCSGEIPFNFTLPKEGEMIGPSVGATPPLLNQLKQTPRHSTPIEIALFSEKSSAVEDVSVEAIVAEESGGEGGQEKGEGKLSLRMKLVSPVEEGSSERFSLQKPSLSDEEGSVVKVTTVAEAVTSSSVFSRVRQVHRQTGAEEATEPEHGSRCTTATAVRKDLLNSPPTSSQSSSLGCNSLANSQSELSPCRNQEAPTEPPARADRDPSTPDSGSSGAAPVGEAPQTPGPSTPHRPGAKLRTVGSQPRVLDNAAGRSPSSKRTISQQTSFDGPGLHSPTGRGEAVTPGPAHRRHVRTIQEVRTTVTRVITDVYYEDGKEVECKVTEESEDPVLDCQVLDSDTSPCRTASSLTSGDLGDISSLSSKFSGGTTSSSNAGCFVMPPSRAGKGSSPRRGGGQRQRGQRGQKAGAVALRDHGDGTPGSRALSPRGRARRGRPPSRSSLNRGAAASALKRAIVPAGQPLSSSEDEPFTRVRPPRLPDSPVDAELPSPSDLPRSTPEAGGSAGSSFIGLRVVAKWSSNGYFYSGRITKDAGEGQFGLRFDDGYECEVVGGDILLCNPIPVETEVTALLEDEYFSVGIVKGHKTEAQELYYSVEREGRCQWHSRSSVILSLEQGNRLREQHSLGPYEPSTPLAKASDISLDNLVEGKRRRRGGAGPPSATPGHGSSTSPRTPGPSGKRKLMISAEERTPAKRGRRGGGCRAAQRIGVCNTSGSGTDLPGASSDLAETHGPLAENASLFLGFAFMLTASSETDRLTNQLASDGEEYVQTAPYNKGYTESQLQAGGGFVLLDFNEEQCKAAYQSLLIADQHCRTSKYLLCVASGVPCVSHIWVRDCCKDNKLLNYRNYLLPAGVGPEEQIVEWHPRCKPFEALRVLLVFEETAELWAQLLTMSGASTVRHYQADKEGSDIPVGTFDVVITDGACPPLVEKSVTSQEVPLVSAEWLIQSLICGERLGYRSKPQYYHDYSSS